MSARRELASPRIEDDPARGRLADGGGTAARAGWAAGTSAVMSLSSLSVKSTPSFFSPAIAALTPGLSPACLWRGPPSA
ncbi:MAG: hypothetical protein R3F43_15685 [bacterium]